MRGGSQKWDWGSTCSLLYTQHPPSAARRPSGAEACLSESLNPGGLHCGCWARGGSPCHGHHPSLQCTSAQASPCLLPGEVGEDRHFNPLLWAGLAPGAQVACTLRSRWPGLSQPPLERKQGLGRGWAPGQGDKDQPGRAVRSSQSGMGHHLGMGGAGSRSGLPGAPGAGQRSHPERLVSGLGSGLELGSGDSRDGAPHCSAALRGPPALRPGFPAASHPRCGSTVC